MRVPQKLVSLVTSASLVLSLAPVPPSVGLFEPAIRFLLVPMLNEPPLT